MLKFVVQPARLAAGAFLAAVLGSDQVYKKGRAAHSPAPGGGQVSRAYKAQLQATNQNCYLEVYVTDTNEVNGPGHVSTSMLRQLPDGRVEIAAHTSYMPVPGGGVVNAPLFGTIPVPAKNFSPEEIRGDDVRHANRILRIPVSEEELQRGVAKQIEIAKAVSEGRYFYSVTGALSGITRGIAALIWAYHASERAIVQHQQEKGLRPEVDPNDMLLLLVEAEEQEASDVLNCTSAAEEVIRETTGCIALEGSVLPASLGSRVAELIDGAEDVQKSLLPCEPPEKVDEITDRFNGLPTS